MMKKERWTFQIELYDALQKEVVEHTLDSLATYLGKRGGTLIIGDIEMLPDGEFFKPNSNS